MESEDRERIELEGYLRRFRPRMPEDLRQRILAPAPARSRSTRSRLAALYLAAAALICTSLPLNAWIDRDDHSPTTRMRHVAIQLLQEELKRP